MVVFQIFATFSRVTASLGKRGMKKKALFFIKKSVFIMNKKLLSVILSGVLMVISAGVFVSCEDYDDDISNLQTQINDLGSTLTALQSQVQAGKWITSVSSTTGGLTIVFSDGTQYTIENGKDGAPGAPGKDGNERVEALQLRDGIA